MHSLVRLPKTLKCDKFSTGFFYDCIPLTWRALTRLLIFAAALTPDTIAKVKVMEENLRKAFQNEFENSGWITGSTRDEAVRKLKGIKFHTAFPFGIKNASDADAVYSNYPDTGSSFWTSWLAAARLTYKRRLYEQDKYEFKVTEANAVYTPGANRITTMAAILHPLVYFPDGTEAHNYGALGQVSHCGV